jgi:hypothetical protein
MYDFFKKKVDTLHMHNNIPIRFAKLVLKKRFAKLFNTVLPRPIKSAILAFEKKSHKECNPRK